MRRDIYTMPEIMFVAGQSNIIRWRLFTSAKTPFNADGCVGNFSIVDYSYPVGEPLISKPLKFSVGDFERNVTNLATVDLQPEDTLGLHGKYIYQITIKDIDGGVEIPNQGFLQIVHNINEAYV